MSEVLLEVIEKRKDGWYVLSKKKDKKGKRKVLGGPYPSRKRAEKRLAQVEMFKHLKESAGVLVESVEAAMVKNIIINTNLKDDGTVDTVKVDVDGNQVTGMKSVDFYVTAGEKDVRAHLSIRKVSKDAETGLAREERLELLSELDGREVPSEPAK